MLAARPFIFVLACIALQLSTGGTPAHAAKHDQAPTIYIGTKASPLERAAATELQRYLYAVSRQFSPISTASAIPKNTTGIVLGTQETLPDCNAAWPFGLEVPQHDGYLLHTIADADRKLVVIAAPTAVGVQYGVYGLLEAWGYGFYLGGDTYPETTPSVAETVTQGLNVSKTPAFAIRGSLPWYNFFNSPTTWELADHKAFVDQLVKMRCNFVGFHTYDTEPYAAYDYNGRLIGGEPLLNTSKTTWGTQSLGTRNFLAGTGGNFDREHFGAASSFLTDRSKSIHDAKQVLAESFRYAKSRGMKVCLGFEVSGDPTDPEIQKQFEARLKALLADYPMLDYVWLWEAEAQADNPLIQPTTRSLWQSRLDRWDTAFDGIPEIERKAEAVRLTLFAGFGHQVLKALRPDIGLVMSGWGGDQWLHCSDFFPGMDKLLPKDIAFSALDNIQVSPTVSKAYGAVSPNRQRWPIIWYEFDGDQWGAQPNLRATASACRDALAKGSQGLLGIHWRTRSVEESATFCAQFAWNPALTVESFSERRARDLYGTKLADKMAITSLKLQALGYRWVGGAGQNECTSFVWTPGDPAKRSALEAIFNEIRDDQSPAATWLQQQAKQDLVNNLSYVLDYDAAATAFVPGGPFDTLLDQGKPEAISDFIKTSTLGRALTTYARQVRNKGELGVLATINTKAWANVRTRTGLDENALAALETTPAGESQPSVLVLPDRIIVTGTPNKKLQVTMKARHAGEKKFLKTPQPLMGNTTFALTFPEKLAGAGPVEYGIEVKDKGFRLTWPEDFPHNVASTNLLALPNPPAAPNQTPTAVQPPQVKAMHVAARISVQLTWTACSGESYTVSRDGKLLGTVSDGWFEDLALPPVGIARYTVLARNLKSNQTATGEVSIDIPAQPLPAPPKQIDAAARANRIILGWQCDAPTAAQYYIVKRDKAQKIIEETYVDADYGHYIQIADLVDPGCEFTYTVAGVTSDKRSGEPSKRIKITSSTEPLKPILKLSFEDNSFLEGVSKLADRALALGGKGWAQLPAQEEWNPKYSLTLSLWVKMDSLEGMPVLICKGAWNQSGYFLQVVNKQLRFCLPGVDTLDAGTLPVGSWQHIVATYGRNEMRLYLNGEVVGRKHVAGRPRVSHDPLLIGRYGLNDEAYFVRGVLDDIRFYDVPLTETEVRSLYKETFRQDPKK